MFVGQYGHALDRKGRVVLPAPYRASVASRGFVTRLDGCLGLWSEDGFREVAERFKAERDAGNLELNVFRMFMSNVRDVKLDAAGRVTLPRELLDELGFGDQVVVSGNFDRVEIWPAERFQAEQGSEAGDELADAIKRLGL